MSVREKISKVQRGKEGDSRVFVHKCQICPRQWHSESKADKCPACGQWHITMSSFFSPGRE